MPKYFVQSKYESFTRQLNGWGFKRLHQSGNDFNAFYHECFLRGMPHLTVLMKRVPPNQGKLLPHVEGEPNFYEIEQQFPLPPLPIPRKDSNNYNKTNHHMMSSKHVPPSTYGGASAKTYIPATAEYGYDYGASSRSLPPHILHSDHFLRTPANLVSSFQPGTSNILYPPSRGECQGRFVDVVEPPFLNPPVTNGQQIMIGGLFPPQYHPYYFENPMLYHEMTPAKALPLQTRSLFSVQEGFRCVTDESGAANNAFGGMTEDQIKKDDDKGQE